MLKLYLKPENTVISLPYILVLHPHNKCVTTLYFEGLPNIKLRQAIQLSVKVE